MKKPRFRFVKYESMDDSPLSIGCPECGWEYPDDNQRYIVVEGKRVWQRRGIKIIKNFFKPVDINDIMLGEEEDKKVTSRVKSEIYPKFSNCGKDAEFGGQTWDETHCCPVHGEFTFDNGWY